MAPKTATPPTPYSLMQGPLAHPESVAATRALAPGCALPIMSAEEDGPLRMVAAEAIVASSSLGMGDASALGWAGTEGWLVIDALLYRRVCARQLRQVRTRSGGFRRWTRCGDLRRIWHYGVRGLLCRRIEHISFWSFCGRDTSGKSRSRVRGAFDNQIWLFTTTKIIKKETNTNSKETNTNSAY